MKTNISLSNLDTWVESFIEKIPQQNTATVICLSGEVGAGKTTLTQFIAAHLGVTTPVTSPTFVIQKEYLIHNHEWIKKLIHIDAYRLDSKSDLDYLGWNDYIKNPHNLIILEWPEQVEGILLPESTCCMEITINNDHTRTITCTKQPE